MAKNKVLIDKLPKYELVLYATYLIGLISYGLVTLVKESSYYKNRTTLALKHSELNFNRENLDIEWNNYIDRLFKEFKVIYFILIPILNYFSQKFIPKYSSIIILIYSIFLNFNLFSIYGVLFSFIINLTFYMVARFAKYKSLIWIGVILVMKLMNSGSFQAYMDSKMVYIRRDAFNEFISIFYFMLLRLISFCLEFIDVLKKNTNESKEKEYEQNSIDNTKSIYSFYNLIMYAYYPSFNIASPFVTFKNFYPCIDQSHKNTKVQPNFKRDTICLIIRISFSIFLIELFLRLTSTFTILTYPKYVSGFFSISSLVSAIYLRGSLFTSKYIVYYGISTLINHLVGMKTSKLPRCISLMHLNSEMWRYFDTGIYDFIKNNLYIPLGGNKNKQSTQFLSLGLSFIFIWLWHGFGYNVALWSLINCLMVIGEAVYFNYIIKIKFIADLIDGLTLRKKRFLICSILSLWQMLMYMNASFFLGNDIGSTNELYELIFFNKNVFKNFPIGYFGFFCNTQIRLELLDLLY